MENYGFIFTEREMEAASHLLELKENPRIHPEKQEEEITTQHQIQTNDDVDQDPIQQPKRKKPCNRHSQRQIEEMEEVFKECPYPNDEQKRELGSKLGLKPEQVKFWFQNKRTQMKLHLDHDETEQLKKENKKLLADNARYKEALCNATCTSCGETAAMSSEEVQLRIENVRLREKIKQMQIGSTSGPASN